MGGEGGRRRVGDARGGHQAGLEPFFPGPLENRDHVLVAARTSSDASSTRHDSGRDGRGTVGRVGDIDRKGRIFLVDREHLGGASDRERVEGQPAAGADQIIARDRDLHIVHAIADDQDDIGGFWSRFAGEGSQAGRQQAECQEYEAPDGEETRNRLHEMNLGLE